VRNPALRRPKCNAVVESVGILVHELHCLRGAAVGGLVDPKIGRIPSNRHQIRNACAETLHIAELQHLGAWHDAGMPSLSTISGDSECAVAPLAQTTCGFTGQTAMRPLVVPLSCGVNVG
jgi:hypothetical protein